MRQKVFLIGFHKTGTMSLGRALKMLGYQLCPRRPVMFNKPGAIKLDPPYTTERIAPHLVSLAAENGYTAFRNFPWSVCYRELYAAFPDAKFVLARRNPQTWIKSVVSHFGERQGRGSKFIYGENRPAKGNEPFYIARYEQHNNEAIAFFADKPGSLLVFDVETADWDQLCGFLGRRKPWFRAYPHRNRASLRGQSRLSKVLTYNLSEIKNAVTKKSGG